MKTIGQIMGRFILLRESIFNQLQKLLCIRQRIVTCLVMFPIMSKLGHGTCPVSWRYSIKECLTYIFHNTIASFFVLSFFGKKAGLPNTFTGVPDFQTVKEADNCWKWAPHQWFNQGCVGLSSKKETLGNPLNEKGGGIYALEWDPANHYIRSWVFTPHETAPKNIIDAIDTSGSNVEKDRIMPDTDVWGLPYAYFAIGDKTGCSSDHFKNMRIVFNLAFCGTVAGYHFFTDCPTEGKTSNIGNDPVASCDAYIKSDPDTLSDAYWKIKGLYVYERNMVPIEHTNSTV